MGPLPGVAPEPTAPVAEVLMEPTDMFWGERFGRVRDPFGHEWGIATRVREMTPAEIKAAAAALFESIE